MARAALNYSERRPLLPGSVDPDVPTAGFYRWKLARGGHPVGLRIFWGQVRDPDTGELLERWNWQAEVNGRPIDLYRVWPACACERISEAEHDHLVSLERWGRENAPHSPQANPNRPIDLLSAPLPF